MFYLNNYKTDDDYIFILGDLRTGIAVFAEEIKDKEKKSSRRIIILKSLNATGGIGDRQRSSSETTNIPTGKKTACKRQHSKRVAY